MNVSKHDAWPAAAFFVILLLLGACAPSSRPATAAAVPSGPPASTPSATPAPGTAAVGAPAVTPTLTPMPSPTPTVVCPRATPELLAVDPVTSSTGDLAQWVTVYMGNMEMVTITAESGIFTAPDGHVEVQLLPNTVHHLEVVARVRTIVNPDGCVYGGYTLRTTTDRYGAPLIIVQGAPGPPRRPAGPIAVDNVVRIEELARLSPDARLVTDFSFRGSDHLLTVGYAPVGRIYGWSLATGETDLEIVAPEAEVLVVVSSPDGTLIATGGTVVDPAVRLWEVDGGAMRELGTHDSYLLNLAFNPSGTLLASGSNDNRVHVWDVGDGQLVATFEGDVPGRAQAFTGLYWPDDHTLIAGGSDAIYTWGLATAQMARRVPAPDTVPFLVETAFAAGGQRLAAVAQDDHLYVWDGEWTSWPAPEPGIVLGFVAFSPDERLVAAGTYDGALYIWDAAGGSPLAARHP
ncbi:MAG: hypothetical protein JXA93_13995, partial [Anaerolineae bacterium]|nr:hypothetical protein [Anaerolineae bacterium]